MCVPFSFFACSCERVVAGERAAVRRREETEDTVRRREETEDTVRRREERGGAEKEELAMCCYVGKATKIFLCLVSALLVVGLVVGFGLAHRTWGARRAQPACRWPDCQPGPVDGDPLPATAATTPPNPLTQPAVAAFPGVASSSAAPPASMPYFGPPSPLTQPAVAAFPGVASSSAAPPASMPYFGPPSPFAVGLGPSSHA